MVSVKQRLTVSTHSRPKAAGFWPFQLSLVATLFQHTAARRRLGTVMFTGSLKKLGFNTQPPEGGWPKEINIIARVEYVSTHSRLKAAGCVCVPLITLKCVSTHSRLKAAVFCCLKIE